MAKLAEDLLRSIAIVELEPGDKIVEDQTHFGDLYVVLDGEVEVFVLPADESNARGGSVQATTLARADDALAPALHPRRSDPAARADRVALTIHGGLPLAGMHAAASPPNAWPAGRRRLRRPRWTSGALPRPRHFIQ